MSEFQVSTELLAIYLEDARSHLEALDHCLLSLEREGLDAAVVSAILGPLHTLKGNSGMIGFTSIKEYVHRLEDVVARIGEGALELEPAVFDRLFEGAAALRDAIERAAETNTEVRDLAPEIRSLDALLNPAVAPAAPPSKQAQPAAADKPAPSRRRRGPRSPSTSRRARARCGSTLPSSTTCSTWSAS
jgi:two-component system, chemotaxis family, sensor kinase CheA